MEPEHLALREEVFHTLVCFQAVDIGADDGTKPVGVEELREHTVKQGTFLLTGNENILCKLP